MKFMPTGGYLEGDSVLHRLDAFVKLLAAFVLLAAVVLTDSLPGYLLLVVVIAGLIRLSGIGFRHGCSGVIQLWLFFVIIFLMNAFFFTAENSIFDFWIFHLSPAGMIQGMHVVFRVALAMIVSNILVATTSPIEITGALESLLFPLKYIGVPIRDVAMILGVAIQFIPTLIEETDMIRKAQVARGSRFESKNLVERAQSILPLLVPIFLSAFRRADELSVAMEARGYHRTRGARRRRKRTFSHQEGSALLLSCLFCVIEILI